MTLEAIKKDIMVLRNYHQAGVEMADKLLENIESLSPSNPRKRQNLKEKRVQKYDNYITSGKWKRQTKVTTKQIKPQ